LQAATPSMPCAWADVSSLPYELELDLRYIGVLPARKTLVGLVCQLVSTGISRTRRRAPPHRYRQSGSQLLCSQSESEDDSSESTPRGCDFNASISARSFCLFARDSLPGLERLLYPGMPCACPSCAQLARSFRLSSCSEHQPSIPIAGSSQIVQLYLLLAESLSQLYSCTNNHTFCSVIHILQNV
jgi:hypothetical protein